MNDSKDNVIPLRQEEQEQALPDLTQEDVMALIRVITAHVLMGATRIEFHPARWRLIFRGLILHRAYDISQVRYIDGIEILDHAVCEVEFATKQGKVGCLLMQRQRHKDETQAQSDWLDSQGGAYDVPDLVEGMDRKIWTPS